MIILKGRRAGGFIGAAKQKLAELRRSAIQYVTAYIGVSAGVGIVQKMDKFDRITIIARDPYFSAQIWVHEEGAPRSDVRGLISYGGATGEVFLQDVLTRRPPEYPRGFITDARTHSVGCGFSLMRISTSQEPIPEKVVYENPDNTGKQTTRRFKQMGYFMRQWYAQGIDENYLTAEEFVFDEYGGQQIWVEPIGEYTLKRPVAAVTVMTEMGEDTGYYYHLIKLYQNFQTVENPFNIWPNADANGGRPELMSIVCPPKAVAYGKIIFVQKYFLDWKNGDEAEMEALREPDLVILDAFNGNAAIVRPLLEAIPFLDDPAYKTDPSGSGDPDDAKRKLQMGPACGFAWSGDGYVTFLYVNSLAREGPGILFTSADSGTSWTHRGWPGPQEQHIFHPFDPNSGNGTRHVSYFDSIYSLAPGHVEFTTFDANTGSGRLWTSTDHGVTFTPRDLPDGKAWNQFTRCPTVCSPFLFDENGAATLTAWANGTDRTNPVVDIYRGMSPLPEDKLYSITYGCADGTFSPIDTPHLTFFGSQEFPAPIKLGHLKALEYRE